MSFFDQRNPITLLHIFRNILEKAGTLGRAIRITKIEGTVVDVPQAPLDEQGFRNLAHRCVTLAGDDNKVTLKVHYNSGELSGAFKPHESYDDTFKLINSLFVVVEKADGDKEVCLNLVDVDVVATATPTGE